MSVFSKMRDFLHRHRNKFIITGALISSVYFASRYAQYKIREWQEREAKEFLERARKSQHFESTERTCNQTILNLSSTLNNTVARIINTEKIVITLQRNPENKIELWDQLKIFVFSRACTLIYTNTLLVIFLRIQLNLIGGYLFKDTKSITSNMQQNYLSMCNFLLEDGLKDISTIITDKVTELLKDVKLNKCLNLYDVDQIFWNIQVQISTSEDVPIKIMRKRIIPEDIPDSNNVYDNIVRETADLLESDEVRNLATACTNRGIKHLIDKLAEFYDAIVPNDSIINTPSGSKDSDTFLHPSKVEIPLAKLIPILNGLLSRNSFPELLTHQLINDDKLKTLGANIYEVFCNNS